MASAQLSIPDYVVIGGYFVIVLWIGFYFRSRVDAAKDYFAGGHQVPWWLAGISHYMSSFSAFSFIAYAQMGYMYGWVSVTLFWATIPGCLAGALFFARRWRRARVITPVEFLEGRFNSVVRQLFAWSGIPMKVLDDALKIFATGLFVSTSTGLNLQWSIAACGLVMVAYTFLGGLWALVVTDYVQFLMKTLAILLLLPLAIVAAGGLRARVHGAAAGVLRAERRTVRRDVYRGLRRVDDDQLQRELVAGAEVLLGPRRARSGQDGLLRGGAEPGGRAADDPARADRPSSPARPDRAHSARRTPTCCSSSRCCPPA